MNQYTSSRSSQRNVNVKSMITAVAAVVTYLETTMRAATNVPTRTKCKVLQKLHDDIFPAESLDVGRMVQNESDVETLAAR